MKRENRKKIEQTGKLLLCILIVLLVCIFLYRAVYSRQIFENKTEILQFTAEQYEGLDYETAKQVQTENEKSEYPIEFVNWTQIDAQRILSVQLEKEIDAAFIVLYGRSDLLFPGVPVLSAGDTEECLISSSLSEKLFGNENTIGLQVATSNRTFEVKGIIESKDSFLVYEADESDTILLDRASAATFGDVEKTKENYRKLCGEWEVVDYPLLGYTSWFVYTAAICFPICCILFLVRKYGKEAGRQNPEGWEKIIWKILFWLILIFALWVVFHNISIPEDMIPSKWSDFEFWSELTDHKKAAAELLETMEKKIPDLPYWMLFRTAMLYSVMALAGELTAFFVWKNIGKKLKLT